MDLVLGNTAVVEVFKKPDPEAGTGDVPEGAEVDVRVAREDLGNQLTNVSFPEGLHDDEMLAHVRQLWPYHSDADGPEWVECDDAHFAESVARLFTNDNHTCQVGRPDGWQEG